MNTLPKEQWIEDLYQLLCKSQGAPENPDEETNLREWAGAIYEWEMECADNVHADIQSPLDVHNEELSCA